MANDRIYIQCRHCGEYTTLAKYYPSSHGVWHPVYVCEFIEKHMRCSPNFGKVFLEDRCFDLISEADDEKYNAMIAKQEANEAIRGK